MGRKRKVGLDYFPLDIDFFQDIKIRKLIRRQGGKAITIYACLLCNIYKCGYYMRWDNELPFIISESTGCDEVYISEVLKDCLALGLLDKRMYDTEGVLTSEAIQERYQRICADCKRKCVIEEYNIISSEKLGKTRKNSEETGISSEETGISSEEMGISSEEMGISSEEKEKDKEKESFPPAPPYKEKEKEKEKAANNAITRVRACVREGEDSGSVNKSPPNTVELEDRLSAELRELRKEECWLDLVAMKFGLKPAEVVDKFSDFEMECRINSKTSHADLGDLKRHFSSWLRIIQKTTKDNGRGQQQATTDAYAKRRSTEVTATSAADYGTRF